MRKRGRRSNGSRRHYRHGIPPRTDYDPAVIWLSALILALVGIALIAVRRSAARVQSMLAGGNIRPGCVTFEGIVFVVMAGVLVLAYLRGWI